MNENINNVAVEAAQEMVEAVADNSVSKGTITMVVLAGIGAAAVLGGGIFGAVKGIQKIKARKNRGKELLEQLKEAEQDVEEAVEDFIEE